VGVDGFEQGLPCRWRHEGAGIERSQASQVVGEVTGGVMERGRDHGCNKALLQWDKGHGSHVGRELNERIETFDITVRARRRQLGAVTKGKVCTNTGTRVDLVERASDQRAFA